MGKPKLEIKESDYYKDIYFLYDALSTLKNIDEVKIFMKDMLTRSELRMLKRRWHIGNLLLKGYDVREAAVESKTSTQTVIRIKHVLENGFGGLILALTRVNEKQKKELALRKKRDVSGGRGSSKFVKGWFS